PAIPLDLPARRGVGAMDSPVASRRFLDRSLRVLAGAPAACGLRDGELLRLDASRFQVHPHADGAAADARGPVHASQSGAHRRSRQERDQPRPSGRRRAPHYTGGNVRSALPGGNALQLPRNAALILSPGDRVLSTLRHTLNLQRRTPMWNIAIPVWELVVRGTTVYVFLIALLRITGKRQVGQLAPFDLVLLLVLSNAVQNSMTGGDNSLVGGLI